MRFGISPIVSGEEVNDFTRRQPQRGAGHGNPQRNPVMGKLVRGLSTQPGSSHNTAPQKRQRARPRQHPFSRRDIAPAWIKHNSRTEHALDAPHLDSAVVMRHTLFAHIERSFFFKRKPSREPLNTHMILVP